MDVEFGVTALDEPGPTGRSLAEARDAGLDAVAEDVARIIDRVISDGDRALVECAREFDDVDLSIEELEVTESVHRATDRIDADLRAAIETAAENVRSFHRAQLPEDWAMDVDGRTIGRRFRALDRVGVYVPGGAATYPSSAIMGVVPAVVAGVDEVVAVTPPADDLPPATLAALEFAGADEVYTAGGAQGIAALAYGTETIPAVEKVVGPGNRYVAAAKRAVQGDVAIDFVAGPSELLVVADTTAEPDLVVADLLAQAEHDPAASVALVTDDAHVAETVAEAAVAAAAAHDRSAAMTGALDGPASGVFLADSIDDAVVFAEAYAAEHLSIQAANDEAIADRIPSAGSVFLGQYTPVAAGDYATGTNHILPTGGEARRVGGVSVDTFLRASTVQRCSEAGLRDLRETITTLARAEGLSAHAESVDARFDDGAGQQG